MKEVFDVQKILKRFGTFIYTGDRLSDLELMSEEITELYRANLIPSEEYQLAKLILLKEARRLKKDY